MAISPKGYKVNIVQSFDNSYNIQTLITSVKISFKKYKTHSILVVIPLNNNRPENAFINVLVKSFLSEFTTRYATWYRSFLTEQTPVDQITRICTYANECVCQI